MATINFAHREIIAKIVYFGPEGSGCQSNIAQLHASVRADEKSELHEFGSDTRNRASLYFDYVPESGGPVSGFTVRFRVYSAPARRMSAAHRHEVLANCDAIVFVADARMDRAQHNVDALLALEGALAKVERELSKMPFVFQVNHCDDDDARPVEQVVYDLNPYGFPVVSAVASTARGVLETLAAATAETIARIRDNLAGNESAIHLVAVHRHKREVADEVVDRHASAIATATPGGGGGGLAAVGGVPAALAQVDDLPEPIEVEVPFQPPELIGTRPIHVLEARISDDAVLIDLLVERVSGTGMRRILIHLLNRPVDVEPLPRHTSSTAARWARREDEDVTASLPDRIELTPVPPPRTDLPGFWYGIAGVVGGGIVGLLLGFLLFF